MIQSVRAPAVGAIKRLNATSSQLHWHSTSVFHPHTSGAIPSRHGSGGGGWQNSRHPARFLSTAASNRASHDSSSIDYVHTPVTEHNGSSLPEVTRIPLLPDTETPPAGREAVEEETIGRVIRPEISIVSGDGTQLDMPSAMSEVTDNHAAELDPYDLTKKVHAAASKGPGQAPKHQEEPGSVKAIWNGFLDDLFGERKPPQA